jgi:hypothetical protein
VLHEAEFLCGRCVHRAERVLGDLPALTRELEHTTVARQHRVTTGHGGHTKRASHPLPVNVNAHDRGRDVLELLFEWADKIATLDGVRGMPVFAAYRPLTELVPHAVAVLLRYSNWMRSTPWGPDLANALHCIRRDLRRLIDCTTERLYAGPCAADLGYGDNLGYVCMVPLFRSWGADEVKCDGHDPEHRAGWRPRGCGAVHQVDDRLGAFLVASVELADLPLRLLFDSLRVLVPGSGDLDWKTVDGWTKPRSQRVKYRAANGEVKLRLHTTPARLAASGVDWEGVPLYRGKDVLRLARAHVRRSRRRRTRRDKRKAALGVSRP